MFMDKLKVMRTFISIVEEGSIVRAADLLCITKAAASKQLIDLENAIKVQLFKRTTRTLELTELGRLFYESSKKVFLAVDEAESLIRDTHAKPVGTLKITSHRHFGEKFILTNLKEFIALYPGLKIDLELADRFPDLEKENIDILCGPGHDGPDYLVRKKIASTFHVLCASPEYLDEFGIPKKPDDLKRHRYITHSFRNPDSLLIFNNKKEVYLDCHIRLNDAQAMLQCAKQGLGIIKIYNYFVEEDIKAGRLIELLKEYREPEKSIYMFYRQQKYPQQKVRVFLDFISTKISF